MNLFEIDWEGMLTLGISPVESVLRGTIVYFVLLTLFRVAPRRSTGDVGMMDLLLLVLIAEAANTAMSTDEMTLIEGVILVITLVGWNYAIDRLTFAEPALEWVMARPLCRLCATEKCFVAIGPANKSCAKSWTISWGKRALRN